jgi:hypothetical protein
VANGLPVTSISYLRILPSSIFACSRSINAEEVWLESTNSSNIKGSQLTFILLSGFYFSVLCISISSNTGAFLGDPDVYWHIAAGRDIWRIGAVPNFDDYSHTFRGHPWIAKEWLSQLILYGAYSLGGWRAVASLAAGVVALTYGALFLALARSLRVAVALGVATLAWAFSMGHFIARPQIFADPLIVVWVAGLAGAVDRGASPSLFLLPVMALWANLHGSFTIGLALAAMLAIEATFRAPAYARAATVRQWALFLLAAVGCASATPYGFRPLLMTFHIIFGNEAIEYVLEWRPRTLQALGLNELTLFGLLFLALHNGVKVPSLRLVPVVALVYLMLAHLRFAALFAIGAPLLLAAPLAEQFAFRRPRAPAVAAGRRFAWLTQFSRPLVYPLAVITILSAAAFVVYGPNAAPTTAITPEGAVDFLTRERLTSKIYNDYNFGGYLIFRGVPTFIDGRSDQLFVGGFLTELRGILERHPAELPIYLRNLDISAALVAPEGIEAQELERSPRWTKVYSDAVSAVFESRKP